MERERGALALSQGRLLEALLLLSGAVFGNSDASEPDVYADYDKLCELEKMARAAIAEATPEGETRQ